MDLLVIPFLLGIGAALYGAVSILALRPRRPVQGYAALLLCITALGMVPPAMLTLTGELETRMHWLVVLAATQYGLGPGLWGCFHHLRPGATDRPPYISHRHWLLPAAAVVLTVARAVLIEAGAAPWTGLQLDVFVSGPALLLIVYASASAAAVLRAAQRPGSDVPPTAAWFLGALVFLLTLVPIGVVLHRPLTSLANGATVLFIIAFGFMIQRHPVLLGIRVSARHADRPRKSEDPELRQRLEELMQTERPYLDEDLTRNQLATHLGVAEKDLSRLLRREFGRNFASYVNGYRVVGALRMLQEEPDRSILNVTYACGFNSRSAFYAAFRKETGRSPSDCRAVGE